MARRRGINFRAYARRRWRVVGLTVVLMAATFLFLTLTDRGHEPLWRASPGDAASVTASPDGRTLLVVREQDLRVLGVLAYDAASGDLLWERSVNLSAPATVAAGREWFAVSTPFPSARLLAYHARGGNVLHDEFLDGEPRAVSADENRLAVALGSGRVMILEDFQPLRDIQARGRVSSIDAAAGRVAVGTATGGLTVVGPDGTVVLSTTRPLQIQSLRLSGDGTKLVLGGRTLVEGDLSGGVEFLDLASSRIEDPLWRAPTRFRVSFTDISEDGRFVLGVEETLTRYTVHYWDAAAGGTPQWSRQAAGPIFRNDPGQAGGAALSPDGRYAAYATDLGGDVTLVDGRSGARLWTYRAEGVTAITFVDSSDAAFATNARYVPNQPYNALLLFDADREPFWSRYPHFAIGLVVAEGLMGLTVLVGAYWWYRRT